ncbi:two-component system phosphate regulon response regulator PhoB [Mobiluncus mulieris]|uniref:Staphylococcal respiratory response protein A n=1 Tax=Mobiluncus mulieris TaxID=2052 RepID=A0A8G2M5N9_9ACTO|nr:response regulator transcription factor [Mobiluncus mulieris]MBB5846572.1 two-component system phosphate regulon response regulator PhoB [Mobiluncus mulieris]STO16952.1 Staphylococcal respiratory response protein A [Mobiluncus mulieris]
MMDNEALNTSRVLVVDDEPQMRSIVTFAMETKGFHTATASSAAAAWTMVCQEKFALIILDLMLPDYSGVELCRRIRSRMDTPIIMLTALGEEEDRVQGLEAGADDYVTKPFSPRELALRASAVLRRFSPEAHTPEILENGELRMDVSALELTYRNQRIPLSEIESRLCLALLRRAGEVVPTRVLLNEVWESAQIPGGKEILKTTVYRLRKILNQATGLDDLIRNVRYRGYLMREISPR